MYSTATNVTPGVMPIDKMLAAIAQVQAMEATPKRGLGQMTVHENLFATRTEPVKKHKHRHAQTSGGKD